MPRNDFSPWILGFRGSALPPRMARAIREGRLSGVILFRDNLGGSVAAARELRREILSLAPADRPFLFLLDEEGGLISQTAGLALAARGEAWASVPTPRALGRIGNADVCRWVGRLLGLRLRALGAQVDLAPCLDLDTERTNPIIGSRSFGPDPARVAELGAVFAAGLAEAGVTGCFKHFPGHGSTREDSHLELATVDPAVRARHMLPFRLCLSRTARPSRGGRGAAAAGGPVPWVMSGHLDWGDGIPASLNRDLLTRLHRWNPRSLVVTDALEMKALDSPQGAAAEALRAGNDLLLVGRDWKAGLEAMAELEDAARVDSTLRAALRVASRRLARPSRPDWFPQAREADRRGSSLSGEEDTALRAANLRQDEAGLRALHRASVRLGAAPETLPDGPWVWVVPEGLAPYADLRSWRPPRGRRRFCQEVKWVSQTWSAARRRALTSSLMKETRPILIATLFRGEPKAEVRELWRPLFRTPGLAVVAHLLDETWPEPGGAVVTALTSGPSTEALDALASVLDLPPTQWLRGPDGLHFPVDT